MVTIQLSDGHMIPTVAVAAVRILGMYKKLAPSRLGKHVLYSGA